MIGVCARKALRCGEMPGRAGQGRATPEEPRELRRDGGASSNTGSLPLFGEMRVSVRGQGRTTGVYSYRTGKAGG